MVGGILILLGYFLVSTGTLSAKSKEFQLLNIFGAVGLILNALVHSALPSAGLNIVWLGIGLYGLVKIIKNTT